MKTGYGLKVRGREEPWGLLFPTYDAADLRRKMDSDYRPEQLEIVRMTWTWEPVEPVEPNDPAVAQKSPQAGGSAEKEN